MSLRARRPASVVALCLVALVAAPVAAVHAADPVTIATDVVRSWGTNGRVSAVLPVGDRVYVAGSFTQVTDPSGATYPAQNLAVYSPSTGAFDTSWQPRPDKAVNALAIADGKLYLGGDFASVDGQRRLRLARLDAATGALDPGWAPSADDSVLALQVSGDAVLLGGRFQSVTDPTGAHPAAYVARVSAQTAAVDPGFTARPSDVVRSLALAPNGTQLYLGGDFTAVSGVGRAVHLASVDPVTGGLTDSFRPDGYNGAAKPPVYALSVDGTRLVIGAGGAGGSCAALDGGSGAVQWSQKANGNVQAVTQLDGIAYCGGHFDGTGGFGGQTRYKLALVDAQSGVLLDAAPRVNSALGVFALGSAAGRVYAGGDFTKFGAAGQPHLATLVTDSGRTAPGPTPHVVVRPGDGSARVVWDVPWTDGGAGVREYRVYRAPTGGTLRLLAKTKDTMFDDTGLVNGSGYQYAVSAVNAIGAGPLSTPVSVQPGPGDLLPPTPPRAVSATNQTGGPLLTWTSPADDGQSPVTSYTVLRGEQLGAEAPVASVPAAATSWTDPSAVPGTTYHYRVVAVNAAGSSDPSAATSLLVVASPPAAPVLSASATTGSVALSWTVPASGGYPITQYTLLRDGVQYARVKAPTTGYTDTAVSSGTTYVYRVRASSAAGNGPLSAPVTVTLP